MFSLGTRRKELVDEHQQVAVLFHEGQSVHSYYTSRQFQTF